MNIIILWFVFQFLIKTLAIEEGRQRVPGYGENFVWKKCCLSSPAYVGCARIVRYVVFHILYIKKISTEKLILNAKIAVVEGRD